MHHTGPLDRRHLLIATCYAMGPSESFLLWSGYLLADSSIRSTASSPSDASRKDIMYAPALLATGVSLLLGPVLGAVTWNATPFNPASVPLAVRTPYLSVWLPQGAGTALNDQWAAFWNGDVSVPGYVLRACLSANPNLVFVRSLPGLGMLRSTAIPTRGWALPTWTTLPKLPRKALR